MPATKTITYEGPSPSVTIPEAGITATKGVPVPVPSAIAESLLLQSIWKSAEGEEIPPAPPPEEDTVTVTDGGFTLGPRHHKIFLNAQAGSFTKPVRLPSGAVKGKEYVFENTATNNNTALVETLEGLIAGPGITAGASITIAKNEPYAAITVAWDGTNYRIV